MPSLFELHENDDGSSQMNFQFSEEAEALRDEARKFLAAEAGYKKPSELSGGMVKRAALARALALDPGAAE